MKTISQAKDTFCPMLMQGLMSSPIESHYTLEDARCLADGCMAWRRGAYEEEAGYCGLVGPSFIPGRMCFKKDGA